VIDELSVRVVTVPTEAPESDGTFEWSSTTVVLAEPVADGVRGLGFTYGSPACAGVIEHHLRDVVVGSDPMDVPGTWLRMVRGVRNVGRPGVASMAIAAVDVALWDLKAKLLDLPLVSLLGPCRDRVPIYGSGGFTSSTDDELVAQLAGWVEAGTPRVKMKVGRGRDVERVSLVREAIGDEAELFVDANGAWGRKRSMRLAAAFADLGVTWFEEPVSSDDLDGLHEVRAATPLDVAAGEYGSDLAYFERMCAAGAVDVLQADVSRCAGITEWLRVAAVAAAHGLEVSGHCAPSLHLHVAAAVPNLRHLEHFHDHVRVEHQLFDGVVEPVAGCLAPDLSRPGIGLSLRASP
jgi:L-alanine-DL-glutamate epimerase-like enolase superfamily enzyme